MTDMTTELTQDEALETPRPDTRRNIKAEFMIYFAIIFVATIPLAMLTWAMQAIKTRSWTFFQRLAAWLARTGVSPNAISVSSIVFAALAGAAA